MAFYTSTGQLYYGSPANANTPQFTPAPQAQPSVLGSSTSSSSSSGGSSGSSDEQKKKDEAKKQQDALNKLISDEYNSNVKSLNNQQDLLGQQQGLTESGITNQAAQSTQDLQGQQAQALSDLGQQETQAKQQTQSVLNNARQTYNELLSGASRFGGSAQQAYGELLGRSTSQTQGEAQTNLQNALTQIAGERTRTNQFYNDKIGAIAKNRDSAIAQAKLDFQAQLNKISDARSANDQWKSQKKLEALQSFQAQIASITDAANTAKNAMDNFKTQQEKLLAEQLQLQQTQLKATDSLSSKFAGPQYSPTQGPGSVTTDAQGNAWLFNAQGAWEPLKDNSKQGTQTGTTTDTSKNWWEQ